MPIDLGRTVSDLETEWYSILDPSRLSKEGYETGRVRDPIHGHKTDTTRLLHFGYTTISKIAWCPSAQLCRSDLSWSELDKRTGFAGYGKEMPSDCRNLPEGQRRIRFRPR